VIADEAIPWEFILIDNSSDDGSGQVSLALWKRSEPIRVVVENQKGLIHARYKGIREAKYEYISFIDDDNWIDPYWIDNIYRIFREHPEVGMCGGQNAGAFEKEPPEWAEKILSSYAIGIQGKATGNITGSKGFVWGAGMSFRKSAFERLIEAGYNSLLTGRNGKNLAAGEDSELGFAFRLAGWKIWYDESLRLQHYIPASRFDWKYVVKMYDGFGSSHAIFGLYKPVLKGKTYQPARFYRKIFRDFWPLYLKKLNGQISLAEGNLDYLKYRLHRAKVLTALKNFYRNRKLIRAIKNLKNTIRKEHQL
jgi:glycosyltransferase involved in cell wall biosynthesis